jgi:hypothetical protein
MSIDLQDFVNYTKTIVEQVKAYNEKNPSDVVSCEEVNSIKRNNDEISGRHLLMIRNKNRKVVLLVCYQSGCLTEYRDISEPELKTHSFCSVLDEAIEGRLIETRVIVDDRCTVKWVWKQ